MPPDNLSQCGFRRKSQRNRQLFASGSRPTPPLLISLWSVSEERWLLQLSPPPPPDTHSTPHSDFLFLTKWQFGLLSACAPLSVTCVQHGALNTLPCVCQAVCGSICGCFARCFLQWYFEPCRGIPNSQTKVPPEHTICHPTHHPTSPVNPLTHPVASQWEVTGAFSLVAIPSASCGRAASVLSCGLRPQLRPPCPIIPFRKECCSPSQGHTGEQCNCQMHVLAAFVGHTTDNRACILASAAWQQFGLCQRDRRKSSIR